MSILGQDTACNNSTMSHDNTSFNAFQWEDDRLRILNYILVRLIIGENRVWHLHVIIRVYDNHHKFLRWLFFFFYLINLKIF